jgi:hypothetical protein
MSFGLLVTVHFAVRMRVSLPSVMIVMSLVPRSVSPLCHGKLPTPEGVRCGPSPIPDSQGYICMKRCGASKRFVKEKKLIQTYIMNF